MIFSFRLSWPIRPYWYCGLYSLSPRRRPGPDHGVPAFAGMTTGLLRESGNRPVLQFHSQREALRRQHFLDLVERLASQVRRLQQLVLRALDEVADVVDVLGLEAVGRTHRELEVVHRLQEDRIDLRLGALDALFRRGLQRREHRQLVDEHRSR